MLVDVRTCRFRAGKKCIKKTVGINPRGMHHDLTGAFAISNRRITAEPSLSILCKTKYYIQTT